MPEPRQEQVYTERLLSYWDLNLMGLPREANHWVAQTNAVCGDEVTMSARIEDGCIKELGFVARSCCMAQCSAAMLVARFRGKPVTEALAFTDQQMFDLVAVTIPPKRKGCVLLGLRCLRALPEAPPPVKGLI